jgi:hypothetical protein
LSVQNCTISGATLFTRLMLWPPSLVKDCLANWIVRLQVADASICATAGDGICLFGFRNKPAFGFAFRCYRVHNCHIGVPRAERLMRFGKARTFDPKAFLAQTGLGKTILQYPKSKVIFAQGRSMSVMGIYRQLRRLLSTFDIVVDSCRVSIVSIIEQQSFMRCRTIGLLHVWGSHLASHITNSLKLKLRFCSCLRDA